MLKFYKVCIRHMHDGVNEKIEFHTWTPKEFCNYIVSLREDYEHGFISYSVSRDNNKIFIDIEH